MKHVSTITHTLFLLSVVIFAQSQTVWAGDNGMQKGKQVRKSSDAPRSLNEELAAMRAKVMELEASLRKQHQGQSRSSNSQGEMNSAVQPGDMSGSSQEVMTRQSTAASAPVKKDAMKTSDSMDGGMKGMSGMGGMKGGMKVGMKPGKKMGMGMMSSSDKRMGMMSDKKMGMGMMGGKGMGMMGRMPRMASMAMPSALPGFPGASHIYHIGSTGFFLDHGDHITLSKEQLTKLNQLKEKTLLMQATSTRQIDEAEQKLWVLTASDEPDVKKIESTIREIAKLNGKRRLAFIRGVGDAAAVLTAHQRQQLLGERVAKDNEAASPNAKE